MARTIGIWGPTGLATPTCKIMLRSTPTTVAETITLAEHGTVKRLYTGTVTAAAGDYYHNLLTAGSYIGGGVIAVSATDGTTSLEEVPANSSALAVVDDFLDTEIAAIKAKTDLIPAAPAAVGDIPTVAQIWTTALTEAYRATGATGTAAQLLHEILQNITEFSITGTTKTVKKFDGSTTAKAYTLDSATTPTSITETI